MEAIERAKELGELKSSFGDNEYARMYPDLSVGGQGAHVFKLEPNPRVITGPFTGDPDRDTFGGTQPPQCDNKLTIN